MLGGPTRVASEDGHAHDASTPEPPPLRASDAEPHGRRPHVLHDAVARGLLTLEECDERVAAAYAARFVRRAARR